jgi:hypothetical protein
MPRHLGAGEYVWGTGLAERAVMTAATSTSKGFLIGPEAFSRPSELTKTVLHELHRLRTTASANGVSAGLALEETKAAFGFAERAAKKIQ